MEQVDAVVVGAGVVGLAVARELALAGHEVLILEAEDRLGTGISSRNSEVVHAGIHYAPGSLKARLCVTGNALLTAYCTDHGIGYRRCGKLVVATEPAELPALAAIQAKAEACGVPLTPLTAAEARALEPDLACEAALLSPTTGIVDSHGLMRSLLAEAEAAGATLVCHSPVLAGEAHPEGVVLDVGGPEPMRLLAGLVVNAAGLGAPALARALRGARPGSVPPDFRAKGSYFQLSGTSPFQRLVYPVPQAAGLGVHLTLDLAGQARFGPDVEWTQDLDYDVDPAKAPAFEAQIRRYWPSLPAGSLQPAYAGIRPKLQGPGDPARDFLLQGPSDHGIPGLWQLLGIESPGLTACLALGAEVRERIQAS